MARILVVDDDVRLCQLFCHALEARGHATRASPSASDARRIAAEWRPHAVVLDLRLPEGNTAGFQLAIDLRGRDASLVCVLVTAYPNPEEGFTFGRSGAVARYLQKPIAPRLVAEAVHDELDKAGWSPAPGAAVSAAPSFHGMVGDSVVMRKAFARIGRLAENAATVLIEGETGTGKELAARAIHSLSSRRAGPFVAVNCSSIAETLFESECFGHERGAFTGAIDTHAGYFERAHRGTLFLDEIGEMPVGLQPRMLRVLEHREITRVGGTRTIPVDVRVLAATNRDLAHAVRNGSFRQELLHRLAGIRLALPPLRDRNGDVDLLVSHFLDRARAELRRPDVSLAPATRALLSGSRWDGNARELANCLRTLVFEAEDGRPIQPDDLPAEVRAGVGIEAGDFTLPDGMTWAKAQESIESRLHPIWLRAVLRETRGNRSAAAARLGIDRHTLRRLLQRHRVA